MSNPPATVPFEATEDHPAAVSRSHELALRPAAGSVPHLTGEISGLVRVRLREVALLVTSGWTVMLVLCLTGRDGLFDAAHLGRGCVAAIAATVATFTACGIVLVVRPPRSMAWLRVFELIFLWASVGCAAWLRLAAVGSALGETPVDPFRVLYAGAVTSAVWLIVFVVYGIFAPNTWRRLVLMTLAAVAVLVAVDGWLWAGRADATLFPPYLLVTLLAAVAGVGVALYGSFKIGTAQEEALTARRQLQELGRYRLTKKLGAGAMGEVYLAEHTLLRRPCAVKLIRPAGASGEKQIARFEREVQATAALTHPNTVEIYDYGRAEDGTFYYAMEYLPGLNLDQVGERHGPLPVGRVVHLLRQVCGALREAHGVGLIHRDVKPANIIVCHRGGVPDVAKLVDFGLVGATDPGAGRLTADGAIAGTPEYMSPEQAEGVGGLDGRSDIYSLGAVAYFLLTGRPPFRKSTTLQLLYAHVHEPVSSPAAHRGGIPADVQEVVLRCLEKDRTARFADVNELDRALAACQRGTPWTEAEAADWWRGQNIGSSPDAR